MLPLHQHVLHHTKKLVHHSKRIIHHGARIAHKHRHILLTYVHIFLVILCFGYYNLDGKMFADEIVTDTITPVINEQILPQEVPTEIPPTETSTPIEQAISPENTSTAENTSGEVSPNTENISEALTGIVVETGIINTGTVLTDTQSITDTGSMTENMTGETNTETGTNTTPSVGGEATTGEIIPVTTEFITGASGNTENLTIQSPVEIPGLTTRLDASDYKSLTITGDNLVTMWQDKRGFAPKAFVEDMNQCPLYVTDVVNNHPALFFNDRNAGMQTNITLTQPYTIFLVYNKEILPNHYASAIGGTNNRFIGLDTDNFLYYASGQVNIATPRTTDDFRIVSITSDQKETNVLLNNENITQNTGFTRDPMTLGLGAISGTNALGGYIAEIIIYDQALSSGHITQLNKYLTNKYYPFTSRGLPKNRLQVIETGTVQTEIQTENIPTNTTIETGDIQIATGTADIIPQITAEPIKPTGNSITGDIVPEESTGTLATTGIIETGTTEPTPTINYWPKNYFNEAYKPNKQYDSVKTLQQILTKIGLFSGNRSAIYDNTTIKAVEQFQYQQGLLNQKNKKLAGYMGPSTRAKLNEILSQYSVEEITNQTPIIPTISLEPEEESLSGLAIYGISFSDSNDTGDFIDEYNPLNTLDLKAITTETQEEIGEETPQALTGDLLLESTNTLSGHLAEVFIPQGTVFTTASGQEFTGEIQEPLFTGAAVANELSGLSIISTIDVGADEQIKLEDLSGNQMNATFTVPTPGLQEGDTIIVNYSQDGNSRYHLDNVAVSLIDGEPYAIFQANHFTIFSLGVWSGTFMINNDAEVTTGLSVKLNTNISGAAQMKFGNSITERNAASWVVYTGSYTWNLTGADGQKTVYAMFSGNGNLAYIQDTIYLDTTTSQEFTGLKYYLDGSYSGVRFFDRSTNNLLSTGVNGVQNTTRSGQQVMGFDGTADYIETNSGFITAYPFTISAWIRPNRVTGTQGIVMFGNSGTTTAYRGVQLSTTTAQIVARNTTARTANGTVTIAANNRYHVVAVFASATSRTIYVNAITGASSANSVTFATTNPQRRVGRYVGTATNYFSGQIDEVHVYNKALNYADIKNLYIKTPSFTTGTFYVTNPNLEGSVPDPTMTVSLTMSGTTYPATNNGDGTRKIKNPIPNLASGTYTVILNYANIYGKTGSITYTNGLKISPLWSFSYTPNTATFGGVTGSITGLQSGYFVTNNNGNRNYLFTGNGTFTFQVQDSTGNQYEAASTVSRIKKGQLLYSSGAFSEDAIKNDGSISDTITVSLTGDTFASNLISNNYITLTNVPTGLTGDFTLSGNQTVIIGLTGTASSHTNSNDISLIISFATGAFTTWAPSDIINSTKTGVILDFLDPYVGTQFYPNNDTMIDADTEPADGCADGICQENNYGATNYLCASDFGSKILLKFDVSSIPTGSIITSAKLRLTKYYISSASPGTGFKLKQIINNSNWIEGTQDNAKALSGEPNYKMRKRGQENWYNGNIGLVGGTDYAIPDIANNTIFTGSLTADVTQEFTLNSYGIDAVQDWLDIPSTNGGIAMMDSDLSWLCIRSKEFGTVGNRPMLTLNYAPDTTRPYITNIDPANNETGISLSNNLMVTFDNKIKAYTGFAITIKRLANNSIFETIGATSGNVIINNNIVTINPNNTLENNTGYYVEIASGAFRDYAGNVFTGFVGSGTWKFSTVNTNASPGITGNIASLITDTTASFSATLTKTGSSAINERGFYRSTTSGFNDGDGTKTSELGSWTSTGTFLLPITGLPSGTHIYFKGFAANGQEIGYTLQSGFFTKPAQPTLFSATNIDNDAFQINWSLTTGTTTYKLYVATNSGFSSPITGYNPKLLSGSLTNRLLTGLAKTTPYYYKLIASNTAGDSNSSITGSATTTLLPTPRVRLKLEETAGSVAYDTTINHNDGILLGGPSMNQTGVDGKSFGFDGINDDVSILDFDYGPSLSISFWFKTTATGDNQYLFSHGDSTGANSINVLLNNSDQTIRTYVNGNQSILNLNGTTYPNLINNVWHLYTVTIDDNNTVAGKKNITVYIDGQAKISDSSIAAGTFNPTNNFTLARRSTGQSGTYYSGYLDDIRIYNKALLSGEVANLYGDFADLTAPTATISYNVPSGTCFSGNVTATLTGYSESITITNNGGSNNYLFTDNGTFTFQFKDLSNNTGEAIATVDRICKQPLDIGGPAMITSGIKTADTLQIIQQEFPDYFRIDDPKGINSGYYTTIAISSLSGMYGNITNSDIAFKATAITTISGTVNPRVIFGSGLTNYQPLNNPITYIKRDPATNSNIRGKYGDTPRLQISLPAYQSIDSYHATINFTLYEN